MKYLGIDYGEAKVGIAIGDDETHLALPYKIIVNSGREKLFSDLIDLVKAESIGTIVIGLPLNTIGESSEQTNKVRRFSEQLQQRFPVQVVLHDERFSSQEAQKLISGKRDDDVAAMIMLQSYFDSNL